VPAPGVGGTATFPGTGPFGITSMTPATVDAAGGTLVTITGAALPSNPRVLVGSSATASVISSSATSLAFRAPARAAGVYDVHVFATDGTESVLTAALTYVDAAGAGSGTGGTGSGTGTGTGGSGTGSGTGTGTGGSGTGTGTGTGGSGTGTGTGTGGSGSPSGGSGTTAPVVVTGPGGERLVRTTKFSALGAIWSMDCSTSCSGVAI
jgi:serine protease